MKGFALYTCAMAALLAAGSSTAAEPAGDVFAPIAMEAGNWDADVQFYKDDKPSDTAKGEQINTLLVNKHWITNQFKIPATDKYPAYEGHGVWGFDPVAKTYVDTWVDTNDLAVRTDYGYWDAAKKTMTWSAKQNDGQGHFVDYRITEEFDADRRVLTFYQLGIVKPDPHPLVRIVFTRQGKSKQPQAH